LASFEEVEECRRTTTTDNSSKADADRIIKRKELGDKIVSREKQCPQCRSTLLVRVKDCWTYRCSDYGDGTDSGVMFDCGSCKKSIKVLGFTDDVEHWQQHCKNMRVHGE
jgi:hypothetical protein